MKIIGGWGEWEKDDEALPAGLSIGDMQYSAVGSEEISASLIGRHKALRRRPVCSDAGKPEGQFFS